MNLTKKDIVLMAAVVVMAGLYAVYFTDWFKHKYIRIENSVRPLREIWTGGGRRVAPSGNERYNISFALHQNYRLTSVQLFRTADLLTNKYAPPIWQLVAKGGSPPTDTIAYGKVVPGMESAGFALNDGPLQPGEEYRLVVQAGSLRGTNDFTLPEKMAARR